MTAQLKIELKKEAQETLRVVQVLPSSLCDTNCVRLLRRVDADTIADMVDDGRLLFVFDVSAKSGNPIRELRFWTGEIFTPQFCARLTLREVIDRILPVSRQIFRGFEIIQLLLISRVTLRPIARQMGAVIRNRTFEVSRAAFAAWLEARWVGRGAQ
jgi:hypothetical protein